MSARAWSATRPDAELLIRGARVVDPLAGLDRVQDVVVKKGHIAQLGEDVGEAKNVREVDASGWLLLPGFVDIHTHLRTPGREDEEDIVSGTAAAAAGGYVALFAMANTDPVVDNAGVFTALAGRAAAEALVPTGFFAAVTKEQRSEVLTEMVELADAGAVGFSDDGRPLATAQLLRRALQYGKLTGRFIAVHAQDDSLMGSGVMHEGAVSARLGLGGIPAIAESVDVGRTLEVARYEQGRVHLCHLSSALSIEHVARAKDRGVAVTAEVTPHHLTMSDVEIESLDSNLKMNPPLRAEADRKALVAALKQGVIDCVATDHAPHALHEKEVPFEGAPFGATGLETAFAALYGGLVVGRQLKLEILVDRMSQAPARIAGLEPPTVAKGTLANLCLVDPKARWTVDAKTMRSRSLNSAWAGRTLTGRVKLTVAAGRVVWEDGA